MKTTDDHFALLGLPRRFDLDPAELERRYLERSSQVHPDRAVGRPADERAAAAGEAMAVNQAYRALRRELPRAEHLFALEGGRIGDNEAVEPALLGEVLERREALATAQAAGDRRALAALERAARTELRDQLGQLAGGFARLAAAPAGDGAARATALEELKQRIIRLRYLERYREAFAGDDDGADQDADERGGAAAQAGVR